MKIKWLHHIQCNIHIFLSSERSFGNIEFFHSPHPDTDSPNDPMEKANICLLDLVLAVNINQQIVSDTKLSMAFY